jgi:hypothetical protein
MRGAEGDRATPNDGLLAGEMDGVKNRIDLDFQPMVRPTMPTVIMSSYRL